MTLLWALKQKHSKLTELKKFTYLQSSWGNMARCQEKDKKSPEKSFAHTSSSLPVSEGVMKTLGIGGNID